ncbi:hypothetical protein [Mesobacillus foraminis]|nr:hypothetical protein [Mesobacillus foraminis]
MKKWALAALAYLLIVIAGYTAYDQFIADQDGKSEEHSESHNG